MRHRCASRRDGSSAPFLRGRIGLAGRRDHTLRRALRRPRDRRSLLLRTPLRDVLPRGRDDGRSPFGADAFDLGDGLHLRLGELLRRLDAVLDEQLRGDVAHSGDRRERRASASRLVLGLGLAAHVELPARQAGRQTHVLALLADGERELVVGDDHLHRALILVHDDLRDLGGRQRAADVLGGVARPRDDVDLLAAQLLHDRLDTRAAHADAGPHWVHVAVVRHHRDLRPSARLPRRPLHLHDTLVDLRHLLAEELDQQAGMRPREDDLRALGGELDVENEGADAVALPVALARDLLLLREDRVRPAEVHDDVLLLEALHDPGDELALAALELVVDDVALGVAHALDDVLLRRLGGDPAELLRRQLGEQLVADLGLRIDLCARHLERHLVLGVLDVLDHHLDLEQLDLAQLGVELRLDVLLVAEGLLGRRQHRLLERLHDDTAVDPFLLAHLLDDAVQIRQHQASCPPPQACARRAGPPKSYSTLAFSMAPNGSTTLPTSGSWTVTPSALTASSVPWNTRRSL